MEVVPPPLSPPPRKEGQNVCVFRWLARGNISVVTIYAMHRNPRRARPLRSVHPPSPLTHLNRPSISPGYRGDAQGAGSQGRRPRRDRREGQLPLRGAQVRRCPHHLPPGRLVRQGASSRSGAPPRPVGTYVARSLCGKTGKKNSKEYGCCPVLAIAPGFLEPKAFVRYSPRCLASCVAHPFDRGTFWRRRKPRAAGDSQVASADKQARVDSFFFEASVLFVCIPSLPAGSG